MGGGAMRTAAKAMLRGYNPAAAPFGVATRRATVSPPSTAVPLAAATATAAEGVPSISLVSGDNSRAEAVEMAPQWASTWEVDGVEWDLEEWAVEEQTNPAPRLVFGPVPTLEEAKVATSDLTDAIEKVYFSGNAAEISGKHGQGNSSPEADSIIPSTPTHVADSIIPSTPTHVVQAFSLLQGSLEAQSVVASLASDRNVWDAVMKNDKVMEFCRNHQSTLTESAAENAFPGTSPEKIDVGYEDTSEGSGLADFFNGVKIKVVEMVSNISDFIQDLFDTPSEATHSKKTENSSSDSYVNAAMGGSFIALAIGVILVVLVKRG